MASTKQRSRTASNGSAATVSAAVKDVGGTATDVARRVRGPMLAAGAAAAGLAGGLAAGSRLGSKRRPLIGRRRRMFGIPLGPKPGVLRTMELLRDGARHLDSATGRLSNTTDDVHAIREQLDRANRQSPIEVLLDGLTHRRGAHRDEG